MPRNGLLGAWGGLRGGVERNGGHDLEFESLRFFPSPAGPATLPPTVEYNHIIPSAGLIFTHDEAEDHGY